MVALKRNLTREEKFGLTSEQVDLATKYLRKHKTAGAIPIDQQMAVYECYLVGSSFHEIQQQFPQYEIPQIILTAALRKWALDRERMLNTLADRVQAKVVKSVMEQVDFLTTMLSVSNADYIADPVNNPTPSMRIESIKDYKEVTESLQKLVAGAQGQKGKSSAMFDAISNTKERHREIKESNSSIKELDAAALISAEIIE